MRKNRLRAALTFAGLCVLSSFWASGAAAKKKEPVSRTVTGIVLDHEDTPIVGAVVEMTDVQTGKKLAIYTSQNGRYQFSDLNARHDYHLQASYQGLSSDIRTASSFDTSNRIVLNFKIPPRP
jgi:hypothetical protein